jgi:hypothetical protein
MGNREYRLTRCAFAATLIVAACTGEDDPLRVVTPPLPLDTARVTSPSTYTLSGVVTEKTASGLRASARAFVNAWIQGSTGGYSYWYRHGQITADDSGRYRLPLIPSGSTARLQVWKDGYVQQCAAPLQSAQRDMNLDAQLVARAVLSSSVATVPAPAHGFRNVSGIVSGADGPIAEAFVDYEPLMDFPAAFTFTDSAGRFLLCGLPDAESVTIGVGVAGRATWITISPGQNTDVEIRLSR